MVEQNPNQKKEPEYVYEYPTGNGQQVDDSVEVGGRPEHELEPPHQLSYQEQRHSQQQQLQQQQLLQHHLQQQQQQQQHPHHEHHEIHEHLHLHTKSYPHPKKPGYSAGSGLRSIAQGSADQASSAVSNQVQIFILLLKWFYVEKEFAR